MYCAHHEFTWTCLNRGRRVCSERFRLIDLSCLLDLGWLATSRTIQRSVIYQMIQSSSSVPLSFQSPSSRSAAASSTPSQECGAAIRATASRLACLQFITTTVDMTVRPSSINVSWSAWCFPKFTRTSLVRKQSAPCAINRSREVDYFASHNLEHLRYISKTAMMHVDHGRDDRAPFRA